MNECTRYLQYIWPLTATNIYIYIYIYVWSSITNSMCLRVNASASTELLVPVHPWCCGMCVCTVSMYILKPTMYIYIYTVYSVLIHNTTIYFIDNSIIV